jgi:hypothetical protein
MQHIAKEQRQITKIMVEIEDRFDRKGNLNRCLDVAGTPQLNTHPISNRCAQWIVVLRPIGR